MKDTMITVICPSCGRRLLSTRVRKKTPRIYTMTDADRPEDVDTKMKCPRCKSIVGIEK